MPHIWSVSTFDFYDYLNRYTPELQAKALRLAGDDMPFARELYQLTATRAMNAPSDRFNAGTVELFVDSLMLEVLEELRGRRGGAHAG